VNHGCAGDELRVAPPVTRRRPGRSGRARLTHPVPQITVSLHRLSVQLLVLSMGIFQADIQTYPSLDSFSLTSGLTISSREI